MGALLTGAAANYASLKYGGPCSHSQSVEIIGTSASEILPNDADRLGYVLVNMSSNLLYVNLGEDPTPTNAIFLSANGGSLVVQVHEDLTLTTLSVRALSTGAGSNLLVQSLRRFSSTEPQAGTSEN